MSKPTILLSGVAKIFCQKIKEHYKQETGEPLPENHKGAILYKTGPDSYKSNRIGNHIHRKTGAAIKSLHDKLWHPIFKKKKEKIELRGRYPGYFLEYIGLKSMQDFMEKYKEEIEDDIYQDQLQHLDLYENVNPYERKQLFFYLYIWQANGGIIPYVLGVYDSLKKAELYKNNEYHYTGEIEKVGFSHLIKLRQKNSDSNSFLLNIPDTYYQEVEKSPILFGTYSISIRGGFNAGKALLQFIEDLKEPATSITKIPIPQPQNIDRRIIGELIKQEIELPNQEIHDLEGLPNKDAKHISKFIGIYEGYSILEGKNKLLVSTIEIKSDLSVQYKCDVMNIYKGHVEISSRGHLWLFLEQERNKNEKFNIFLKTDIYQKETFKLFGALQGILQGVKTINSHNVLLKQENKKFEYLEPKQISFESKKYKYFMDKHQDISAFLEVKNKSSLAKFGFNN